nr:hypothetical protein [Sinorhizobium meliloti]
MSEWIDFERWPECKRMERPGIAFEVTNGDQTLLTAAVRLGCSAPALSRRAAAAASTLVAHT